MILSQAMYLSDVLTSIRTLAAMLCVLVALGLIVDCLDKKHLKKWLVFVIICSLLIVLIPSEVVLQKLLLGVQL